MAKAYNLMEWDFLGIVLEAFGFNEEFIKSNLECISYVFFSILFYRSSFGLVTPTKGLRQEIPSLFLSVYLGCQGPLLNVVEREREK